MPLAIPNTTTADDYTAATTFGGQMRLASGYFTIANATAGVRLLVGEPGQRFEYPEVFLPPGTYPVAPGKKPVTGIQFRSFIAGTPCQVFGTLFYPGEPSIGAGSPFDSVVSAAGGIGSPNPVITELERVLLTANAAANLAVDDIVLPTITLTEAGEVEITVDAVYSVGTTSTMQVFVYEGGVQGARLYSAQNTTAVTLVFPFHRSVYLLLAAGAYVFSTRHAGSTLQAGTGVGGLNAPAFLRARQIG